MFLQTLLKRSREHSKWWDGYRSIAKMVDAHTILKQNSQDLNFEDILRKAIARHIQGILFAYQFALVSGVHRAIFSPPGEITLDTESGCPALHLETTMLIYCRWAERAESTPLRGRSDGGFHRSSYWTHHTARDGRLGCSRQRPSFRDLIRKS